MENLLIYPLVYQCSKSIIKNPINLFDFKDADKIYEINSWIKENYKTAFSVDELAKQVH